MRRNDEEFKAELLLRVEKYKEHRKKQCRDVLKAASVAMMVCVLVVSSRWGKLATLDWFRPLGENVADQTVAENESFAGEETERETDEETQEQTEPTDASIWTGNMTSVYVQEQTSGGMSSAGGAETGNNSGNKKYQDENIVRTLLDFLTERIETAERIAADSSSDKTDSDKASYGKKYRITINFDDGRAIAYQVAEGKDELKIVGGRLVLDGESWNRLMQILEGR